MEIHSSAWHGKNLSSDPLLDINHSIEEPNVEGTGNFSKKTAKSLLKEPILFSEVLKREEVKRSKEIKRRNREKLSVHAPTKLVRDCIAAASKSTNPSKRQKENDVWTYNSRADPKPHVRICDESDDEFIHAEEFKARHDMSGSKTSSTKSQSPPTL